jgi:hypothetical protein
MRSESLWSRYSKGVTADDVYMSLRYNAISEILQSWSSAGSVFIPGAILDLKVSGVVQLKALNHWVRAVGR